MAANFTIFVDRVDGGGYYRDFTTRAGALKRHSKECRNPNTERSVVKEYSADDPEFCKVWADYRNNSHKLPKRRSAA